MSEETFDAAIQQLGIQGALLYAHTRNPRDSSLSLYANTDAASIRSSVHCASIDAPANDLPPPAAPITRQTSYEKPVTAAIRFPVPELERELPEQSPVAERSDDGWASVYSRLKAHDKSMIDGYTTEMDTLLIFAGLFSAVLTALLVEVYSQLQPDDSQVSAQILGDLSRQIHSLSLGQEAPASAVSKSYRPPAVIVVINALWFLCLVLSLATALFAIFVKQWMREYLLWTDVSSVRDAVLLRQYRFESLDRWRVKSIVTMLPALLQLAVMLFLTGLLILLWTLNHPVAIVATVATAMTLVCAFVSIVLPVVRSRCPYRTPLSWAFLVTLRGIRRYSTRIHNSLATLIGINEETLPTTDPRRSTGKGHADLETTTTFPARAVPTATSGPATISPFYAAATTPAQKARAAAHAANHTVAMHLIPQGGKPPPGVAPPTSWQQHDELLSRVALGNPVHVAAYMCRPLLWLSAQARVDAQVLALCAGDPFGAADQGARGAGPGVYAWPDNPHKRMCAYWLALSRVLGFPVDATPIPLYNAVRVIAKNELTAGGTSVLREESTAFELVKARLVALSPPTREALFFILHSGIANALDQPKQPKLAAESPFGESDMGYIYVTALYMMRRLCHRWSGLHVPFLRMLLRVRTEGERIAWPDHREPELRQHIWKPLFEDTARYPECSIDDFALLVDATVDEFNPHKMQESRGFWALANAALALRLKSENRAHDAHMAATLLDTMSQALDALHQACGQGYGPTKDDFFPDLWPRLVAFCMLHPHVVPPQLGLRLTRLWEEQVVEIDFTHELLMDCVLEVWHDPKWELPDYLIALGMLHPSDRPEPAPSNTNNAVPSHASPIS